jgi:hypothetical protein
VKDELWRRCPWAFKKNGKQNRHLCMFRPSLHIYSGYNRIINSLTKQYYQNATVSL